MQIYDKCKFYNFVDECQTLLSHFTNFVNKCSCEMWKYMRYIQKETQSFSFKSKPTLFGCVCLFPVFWPFLNYKRKFAAFCAKKTSQN